MASAFPTLVWLVIAMAGMVCTYLFVPKGANQVTIRTAVMLTIAVCYFMWMITYLAQVHPLLAPIKSLNAGE